MEDDANQTGELSSHLRVMKTYLKAKYRLSDLLRAQRIDRMISSLKVWIEIGAPHKRETDEDSYLKLRQYFMQKKGRLYLNKDKIVDCKRRDKDKVFQKHNATVLPHTEILSRSHVQLGHQWIDKAY